jgi:hypothetical protein
MEPVECCEKCVDRLAVASDAQAARVVDQSGGMCDLREAEIGIVGAQMQAVLGA